MIFPSPAPYTALCCPFESLVYESGRSISTDIADGLTLHGEERRITQLVMILLDNAVKNSYEGSEIRVTLRQNGDKRLLTVENQGEGIPAADLPHIFERFYRADTSRSRETRRLRPGAHHRPEHCGRTRGPHRRHQRPGGLDRLHRHTVTGRHFRETGPDSNFTYHSNLEL